jgi:hypothetical protein
MLLSSLTLPLDTGRSLGGSYSPVGAGRSLSNECMYADREIAPLRVTIPGIALPLQAGELRVARCPVSATVGRAQGMQR